MKVVIIGGSAQSVPALSEALDLDAACDPVTFVLAGRNASRLDAVVRASRLVARDPRTDVQRVLLSSQDFDRSLADADVVLLQIRVGGYQARFLDELLARRFRLPVDQEVGPVAMAAAWRSWPVVRAMLERFQATGGSGLVLLLTSPMGPLIRAARRTFPDIRLAGVCELPWVKLQNVCSLLDVDPSAVRLHYSGVTHFGCFHGLSFGDRDLVSEYNATTHMDPVVTALAGGIPTIDVTTTHRNGASTLVFARNEAGRSRHLHELKQVSFPVFRSGQPAEIRTVLRLRPTPWYADAIAPLISGLAGQKRRETLFLSTSPAPDLDVMERPFQIRNRTLSAMETTTAPDCELSTTVRGLVDCNTIVSLALVSGDVHHLADAVPAHPWVREVRARSRLAAAIVERASDMR